MLRPPLFLAFSLTPNLNISKSECSNRKFAGVILETITPSMNVPSFLISRVFNNPYDVELIHHAGVKLPLLAP